MGGHSLLAAIVISKLRENLVFQDLAVLDIYQHPTVAKLAAELTTRHQQPGSSHQQHGEVRPTARPNNQGHIWMSLGTYVLYFLYSLPIVFPYYVFDTFRDDFEWNRYPALAMSGLGLLLVYPSLVLVSIALKWIVIGKYRPGSYPLWGSYYWRFWFVCQMHKLISIEPLAGSPLLNTYYRLLGAKVAPNVYLGGIELVAADLVSIGANTSINYGASLVGFEIVDGRLEIGSVTIGHDCFVGSNTMLGLHTKLEDRSQIGDLSYLGNYQTIPTGNAWIGSPARLDPDVNPLTQELTPVPECSNLLKLGYLIGSIGIWIVPFIAAIPAFLLWRDLLVNLEIYELLIPAAILGSLSFVGVFCLQVLVYKWLLLSCQTSKLH